MAEPDDRNRSPGLPGADRGEGRTGGQEPLERQGPASPVRAMLRRLRDLMAGGGSVQARLNETVRIISSDLSAQVCSIYIRRTGNVLELCATEGLNADAVYRTRMRFGEGLVGHIAETGRPLNEPEAQAHPKFAYFPETGEEIYHSLMGVPIRRSERVVGVLVIQNAQPRRYTEEEIESLETLAMVLAEILTDGDGTATELGRGDAQPSRLTGTVINSGLGIGVARHHRPRTVIRKVVAEDPDQEISRLEAALARMHAGLDRLLATEALAEAGEHRDVLETYQLLARDAGWIEKMRQAIRGGLTAEAAVQKVRDDTRSRMAAITDPYLRERLADFEDMALRLLNALAPENVGEPGARGGGDRDWILVARSMGPAELLDYDPTHLKGLALEQGSATAHVAIVARALNIPVMARLGGLLAEVEPGDTVIVDADHEQVLVRPGAEARAQFEISLQTRDLRRAHYAGLRDLPARSPDGVTVSLSMNAGLLVDLDNLAENGADGVGLYRTEIPFMVRREFPGVDAQTQLYSRVFDKAGGRPVTFRTLDVGGDKRLPSFSHDEEDNPALGWRALRIGLDHPAILRQQVRALLRACAGRPLSLMFPMVSTVEEYLEARSLVDLEIRRAARHGQVLPADIAVGAMVEVPSLLWEIERLADAADFLSIGSNDLFQFLFAADRDSDRLARRYDPLHPVFLTALRRVFEAGEAADIPVTVCGEMAGRPVDALVMTALGARRLSMSGGALGFVKEAIRSNNINLLENYIDRLIEKRTLQIRNHVESYLRETSVTQK